MGLTVRIIVKFSPHLLTKNDCKARGSNSPASFDFCAEGLTA